jgi:predicted PurR-regulated permease PerM
MRALLEDLLGVVPPERRARSMLPPDQAARAKGVLGEVTKVISSSLVGNLAISLIAGTVVGVTAWLIGAPSRSRWG